jgi:hypothetical protein
MKLLTAAIRKQLPKLYSGEDIPAEEKVAVVKFFDPCGRATFYMTEFDGEDRFFGYCVSPLGSDCDEWGYSSLAELSAIRNRMGLGIERDTSFKPTKMGDIFKKMNRSAA